jgi:ATP-dependent RNA helicase DeaD
MIERKTKAPVVKKMLPTGMEVCEAQLFNIIKGIHEQEVHHADIEPFMERIQEELKDLSKEELIKRFASVEFNRFLSYYRNAPDINIYPKGDKRGVKTTSSAAPSGSTVRLFVSVGEMDGVTKKDFLKLLDRSFGVPSRAIGQIDLSRTHLHFDLDAAYVGVVRQGLPEFTLNGRAIRVDDASQRDRTHRKDRDERVFEKWDRKPKKGGKKGKW